MIIHSSGKTSQFPLIEIIVMCIGVIMDKVAENSDDMDLDGIIKDCVCLSFCDLFNSW